MDQLATALRQVARMLWGIHVTLQMGFEQEASPASHAQICIFICMFMHVDGLLDIHSCVGMFIHGTCCSLLATSAAGFGLTEEARPVVMAIHCL